MNSLSKPPVISDRDELTLHKLLAKYCEREIPMHGKEAKRLDCYLIYFKLDDREYVLTKYADKSYFGEKMRNSPTMEREPATFSTQDFRKSSITIRHHWKGNIIDFEGLRDYWFHRITRAVYFKMRVRKIQSEISKFLYGRKLLLSPDRIMLLQTIVDIAVSNRMNECSTHEVEKKLLGKRWASHPNGLKEYNRYRLNADSLVESGEVHKTGDSYRPTGKSIVTLQNFEIEERRHSMGV